MKFSLSKEDSHGQEAYVIWMHTNTDEEQAFYDDMDMFSLCKPDLARCEKYELEFYDENDHLVETFEKSGYTAPLHD